MFFVGFPENRELAREGDGFTGFIPADFDDIEGLEIELRASRNNEYNEGDWHASS